MNTIIPHLWFSTQAIEAATYYSSIFPDSRVIETHTLHDTPSGDAAMVSFELAGVPMQAISAGPEFQLNPSVSLLVACSTAEEVDTYWKALAPGGTELMPLGEYPFSERYSWVMDRFGLTWQLMLIKGAQPAQKIVPYLLFAGAANGHAAEAVRFYTEVFANSGIDAPAQQASDTAVPADIGQLISFHLLGQPFFAMDHGFDADFTFNEAFSLIVLCDTQAEIDHYWQKLSHVPASEACGWLKDRFGVSWQIVPRQLHRMLTTGTPVQRKRVTEAFLKMKKFDIQALQAAFDAT